MKKNTIFEDIYNVSQYDNKKEHTSFFKGNGLSFFLKGLFNLFFKGNVEFISKYFFKIFFILILIIGIFGFVDNFIIDGNRTSVYINMIVYFFMNPLVWLFIFLFIFGLWLGKKL